MSLERVDNPLDNPVIKPLINSIAMVYDLTLKEEYDGILTAVGFNEEKISRFLHVDQSREDLIMRIEAMKIVNSIIGDCNYRCTGHDAINALYSTTYEIDKDEGTKYHERFKSYLEYLQKNDLLALGVITDLKGDRSRGPKDQNVKDTYLHIVEEKNDGTIVRELKCISVGLW